MDVKGMYRLQREHIAQMAAQPETGMGYQVVQANVNGYVGRYYIFNCELIVSDEDLPKQGYFRPEEDYKDVRLVDTFQFTRLVPLSELPPPTGGAGAPPSPVAPSPRIVRKTLDFEGFARVSPFPKDWRVKPDGALEKDTYATTVNDLRMVPSGFAASGRYALPNPAAARFVFIIVPGPGHSIDGGTVRPAYNQAGGGVEVLFVDGAPKGSVRPYRIPEL